MKSYILFILVLLTQTLSYAQQKNCKITGKIIDSSSRSGIEYATVTVFKDGNTVPVGGAMTEAKGAFTVDGLTPSGYKIKIDFIGYRVKTVDNIIISDKQCLIDLGKVLIVNTSKSLNEVNITAKRNLVENHIDKLVYNAEKDVTSSGGMAADVLRKVPQVSVDVNGNVELQGNGNVKVFINGKPSTMFDNNLAEALAAIPASMIKSIEVITSPGSKYDAEGTAGIINIILKDNTSQGVNGSFTLTGGTRFESASGSIHVRKNNFDLSFSMLGNIFLNSTTLSNLNRSSDSLTQLQNGNGTLQRNAYKPQAGFNWAINKRNNLSGSVSYNNYGNTNNGFAQQQVLYKYDSSNNAQTTRNSNSGFRNRITDWSIDYRKKFEKDGEEMGISCQQSIADNSNNFGQLTYSGTAIASGAEGNNSIRDRETYVTIDYSNPIKKNMTLEIGAKGSFSDILSNSAYSPYNILTQAYVPDSLQADNFSYKRNVFAAYASFSFPLSEEYIMKLGTREEYTRNDAHFSSGAITVPSYNTVIPTLTIAHNFKNNQTLKISYSGRIQRPGYRILNPFVNASDPSNVTQGNPYLKPERTQYGELSYYRFFDKGGSILINAFYRNTQDDEQTYVNNYTNLKIGDSTYTNVNVTTNVNVGVQQTTGCNIYGTLPLSSKLELRGNAVVFDKYITSSLIKGNTYNSINYRMNINATYQLSDELVFEFFGNFNSAHTEIQGKFPSFSTYSFAVRKLLFHKKGSIAFTTTDPFNEYVDQRTNINGTSNSGAAYNLQSDSKIPYRTFGLSFNYKFGKLEYKEKKEDKAEQNGEDN